MKINRKQKESEHKNANSQNICINIYKCELVDIEKRGYLMLKHNKNKNFKLLDNYNYLLDKVRLMINKKGDIILSSTSSTVIR